MTESSTPSVVPISSAPSATTAPRPATALRDAGDAAAEYAALRTGALLVDHAGREFWTFRGAKAKDTVTGLVTNDVAALTPGLGCYAAALTAKGRIIADVRIFACDAAAPTTPDAPAAAARVAEPAGAAPSWLDDVALVVDVPPRAAEGWGALVRKYVNPRVTPYRHEGERLRAFGVYGVRARDAVAIAFGAPPAALAALPPYAHATIRLGDTPILVARVPDLGLDGFLIIAPADQRDAAWARVQHAGVGVVVGGETAYATARVEAGYPEWGVDIDETTIPQEANLDELHAISYTKGCYTGQEVVARIHFRGHVNRHLRGITAPGDGNLVPIGAELVDDAGKVVGDVRSSAHSPRLGDVALAMVRREVVLGATLRARWPAAPDAGEGATTEPPHERAVIVSALPFPG